MKSRITSTLIYLSTLPILSFAQQNDGSPQRGLTEHQRFEAHRGEVENFKTLTYRFEVAWQEADLQSMVDLKKGLETMMEKENERPAISQLDTDAAATQLQKKLDCTKKIAKLKLSTADTAFGKKAEQLNELFKDYIRLLESELTAHLNALRPTERE